MIKGRIADGSVAVIIDEDKGSVTFNQVKDKAAGQEQEDSRRSQVCGDEGRGV